MAMTPIFEKKFGQVDYTIHTSKMTPSKIEEIKDVIAKIRGPRSIYSRVPMEPGESNEEFLERASLADPEIMRKSDETTEEHVNRIFRPKVEAVELGFQILNGLAPLFGQREIERADYDSLNFLQTSEFVFNVLNFAGVPAQEFAPKIVVGSGKGKG